MKNVARVVLQVIVAVAMAVMIVALVAFVGFAVIDLTRMSSAVILISLPGS